MLGLLSVDFDSLPCTLAIREELWQCFAGIAICNIELQNEVNFSYCIHSINPLFSIVISTTITITTINIITITITTITIPTITITIITFTTITITTITSTSINIATITITRIGYFTLGLFFHDLYVTPLYQWTPIHHYQLAPSEARLSERCEHSTAASWLTVKPDPLLTVKPDPLLPAKPDPPLTACSQQSQIVREVRVSIPPLPAFSKRSQIHR